MTSIHIDWDRNLSPEKLDRASEKAAQRATFKKFVAASTSEEATLPKIGIAR